MSRYRRLSSSGFTIVELLIVIVVIAILAAIVIVTYNGIQERARNTTRIHDIRTAQELIEAYNALHGEYPKTTNNPKANWRAADVRSDDNCVNGSSQADWVPGISNLPQSDQNNAKGVDGVTGCYLYVSNGTEYVISAWNMVSTPQTTTMYRRLGFREFQTASSTQFYTCNSNTVGGAAGGYAIAEDYYKHSFTVSNITDCNETPPPGA
ncbi:MAG TPA: type II secretion system protein [Candidatus Saccharimonadales bacterium]|nr:type II secretion system protein [Candidatus Saccharimonadales bacterium]